MTDIDRMMSWSEVQALATLVAAHWERHKRNPSQVECDHMMMTARLMSADGQCVLNYCRRATAQRLSGRAADVPVWPQDSQIRS